MKFEKIKPIVSGKRLVTKEEIDYSVQKEINRLRRKYARQERFWGVIKYIIFTPLIKIFEILTAVAKLLSKIGVLAFFYGVYKGYEFYKVGDVALLKSCVLFCISPFIAMFLAWLFENLYLKMECSIDVTKLF